LVEYQELIERMGRDTAEWQEEKRELREFVEREL